MGMNRIGIVGAGPAGARAAFLLKQAGVDVVVFEKSRGPGGRCATRWAGEGRWDHGAPGFTVSDSALEPLIQDGVRRGILSRWGGASGSGERALWTGNPSMSALSGAWLEGVELETQTRVTGLGPDGRIQAEKQGEVREFRVDHVALAIPAPQVCELLEETHPFQEPLGAVHYAGTLTAMLEFEDAVPVDWERLELEDPILQTVIRNQTKSGRPAGERWVLHGTAADAEGHMHLEKEVVGERLMNALRRHLKDLPEPSTVMGHRWKYANVVRPCGVPFLRSESLSVIGDGLLGGGVEGALLSAQKWVQALVGAEA